MRGSWLRSEAEQTDEVDCVASTRLPPLIRHGCAVPPSLVGEGFEKGKASRVGGFFLYLPEIPVQDGGELGSGGGGLGIQGAVGAG